MTRQDLREQALRLLGLFRRHEHERELAEELDFHLAMRQQKYRESAGAEKDDAVMHARRDLGSVEKWKDACRDVSRLRPLEDFGRDLILAVRMLRKSPAFTAVALITLALAISANTAIFSLINAMILRPLPVPQADRLAILRRMPDEFGYALSYPLFRAVEKDGKVFSHVFAFAGRNIQIRTRDGMDRVSAQLVSGQYFPGLRVNPEMGRYLDSRDDRRGGERVAVISDHFWRTWFGSDPRVLGKTVVLANVVFTVVGVMPSDFRGAYVTARPDIFLPFELEPVIDAPYNNISAGFRSWWFQVGLRLRDGVSLEQANVYLNTASRAMIVALAPDKQSRYAEHGRTEIYLAAEPGRTGYSWLRLRFRKPLSALMALVSLVLLIACLNLATLLMARAASREREIATRFALGASRIRLLRQLLTESMLLVITGTVLGLALSPLLSRSLLAFLSSGDLLEPPLDVAPDARVFVFTAAVAGIATLLTGMAPALRSTGRALQQRMREGSAALRGSERRHFWPRVLLAGEVALALVLVTGAGLLGYSLVQLHDTPTGFEPQGLLMLQFETEKQSRDGDVLIRAYHDVADGLAAIPGVQKVSYVNVAPLMNSWWTGGVNVPGQPKHEFYRNQAGADYFRAMRTPLLAGREFRWTDTDASPRVVILNEAASRVLFPHQNPIGQQVSVESDKPEMAQVVGVVGDAKYATLRDIAPPAVYSTISQDVKNRPSYMAMVRVSGSPTAVISAARNVVRKVIPEIPPPVAVTMEQAIAESLASERLMATLALFFAAVALLITGIGLYGTLAYTTARRTGEIGIRFALGAQRSDVLSMVCRENGMIALGGCVAGLAASVAASRLIASFLYSTSPRDPMILGLSALLLVCIAIAASLIPAVRASRIDPITAIRYE